jgi:hemerythrin
MTETPWTENYSVGDPIIDGQHRQLIDTMNDLARLLEAGTPSFAEATQVFGRLAVYVLDHFTYEEQRMKNAAYPAESLARHQAIHADLTRQVRAYQQRVAAGDTSALAELLPFLRGTWLLEHISETDRQYQPYLAARKTA